MELVRGQNYSVILTLQNTLSYRTNVFDTSNGYERYKIAENIRKTDIHENCLIPVTI